MGKLLLLVALASFAFGQENSNVADRFARQSLRSLTPTNGAQLRFDLVPFDLTAQLLANSVDPETKVCSIPLLELKSSGSFRMPVLKSAAETVVMPRVNVPAPPCAK